MQQMKQARQEAKEALKRAADLELSTRFEPYQLGCYVLVERSARLELDGYDSVVWHVALEACASSTL